MIYCANEVCKFEYRVCILQSVNQGMFKFYIQKCKSYGLNEDASLFEMISPFIYVLRNNFPCLKSS